MLVANIISNNTSMIHSVESCSDHGNSMEDTLEAEISKLETTINDIEAENDLPDVDMCPSDLEEGEILDSFLYEEKQSGTSRTFERNLVIDNDGSENDKYITCDVFNSADKGILDPEEKSQNMEYNNGDEHTVLSELNETDVVPDNIVKTVKHEKDNKPNSISYLTNSSESETLQITDSTHSPEPDTAPCKNCSKESQQTEGRHETGISVKTELEFSNENKCNCTKSVIISNNCEAVSLKKCDFELSTNDIMVHLNSKVASTYKPHLETNDERNEASSCHSNDSGVKKGSLLVDVDDVIYESSPESYLQLDTTGFEDALLYDEDDDGDDVPSTFARIKDNEPVVSSTPLKIKADTLKRWKPTFLSPNAGSFLILDEFEDFIENEQSICSCINSPVQNKSVQEAGSTHSTKHRSLMCNSLLFKVNEDSSIADMKVSRNNDNEHAEVAFDEAGDVKIVLQLSDDGLQASSLFAEQSPLLANASPVQGHGIQDIFVSVKEDRNMGTVNWETTESSNFPSESMNQNSLEQKQIVTTRNTDDYISNNPEENFDNNNPEWELLRKLETDEERYRAVRQRWRNLTIPDPNQDLTCRNWRIRQNANKVTASAVSTNSDTVPDQTCANGNDVPASIQGHHKRCLSDPQTSTTSQPPVKRPRTQSCTTVFDVKLEQLRRNIHYEQQRIYNQKQLALRQLRIKQIMERYILQKHCRVHGQMLQLYYQQQGVGNCSCNADFSLPTVHKF